MSKIETIPPKDFALLKEVNSKLKGSIFGTEDLEDFVRLFFVSWTTIRRVAGAQGFSLAIQIAEALILPVLQAIGGVGASAAQIMDLQDEEIAELVALGDGYELGADAVKAKQTIKLILTAVQTYSVFVK